MFWLSDHLASSSRKPARLCQALRGQRRYLPLLQLPVNHVYMVLQPLTLGRKKPLSINLPQNEVVADLERIFKPLDGRALVPAFHYDADVKRPTGPNRKWRRQAFIALVLFIATVATLTIAYERPGPAAHLAGLMSVERPSPSTIQTISPILTNTQTAAPVSAPVVTSSTEVSGPAQQRLGVRYQLPVVDHSTQLARNKQFASPKSVSSLHPRTDPALAPTSSNVVQGSSATYKVTINPAINEYHADVDPRSQCLPESPDDRCIYQDVMNADARLRRAFKSAVQGGVSRPALLSVLREWNIARRQATSDPDQTINRYEQLKSALDQEIRVSPK